MEVMRINGEDGRNKEKKNGKVSRHVGVAKNEENPNDVLAL